MTRKGDWLQTFTGLQFWPLDPYPEDVCIEDIAHALSNICRYGGHSRAFYSVAEHSVIISDAVLLASRVTTDNHHQMIIYDHNEALRALLHDASEAYLADVPRPVKPFLKGYMELEHNVEMAIALAFDLDHLESPMIKELDSRILWNERAELMTDMGHEWAMHPGGKIHGVWLRYWSPKQAEEAFLKSFVFLQQEVNRERREGVL